MTAMINKHYSENHKATEKRTKNAWKTRLATNTQTAGAKFSKLLRKIFGRLVFQRKHADFRNFFRKCLKEFEKIFQRRS